MTSQANARLNGTPSVPFWATPWICAIIVLAISIPRVIFAIRYNLVGDEAYYAVWSLHPGFGYWDHPPAIAWVIWLGRTLFGEGEFGVRSLIILSSLLTSAALYRIAAILFTDRRIAAVAAIGYAATPAVALAFGVATPDAPSTLAWVAALWAVAEFTRSRNPWWWLAVGAIAGFGLLSKYTVAFLGAGLVLYFLTSRERFGWLKIWQVWAGGLLALAMFAPVVWIDYQRDWSSFRFQGGRGSLDGPLSFRPNYLVDFLAWETALLLPTLAIFTLIGLALFAARRAPALALPIITSAPMLGFFLLNACFGRVNANWTSPMLPMLALVGAWAAIAVRPSPAWLRWPLDALKLLHVPLGLAAMVYVLIAVETLERPGLGPDPGWRSALGYVHGWQGLQAKISDLAKENGAVWVDTPDYGLNGGVAYYTRMANDPLPVFHSVAPFRYRWAPMPEELKDAPHLSLFEARGDQAPEREGLSFIARITRDSDTGEPLGAYDIYLSK